jgi:biotin operon repressor
MTFRITIVETPAPHGKNLNDKLLWFGGTFGLFGNRDKDKSCFRIFIELIKHARNNAPVSSDEIAENLSLSRGTVVHHINKLMSCGFIINKDKRYFLKVSSLRSLVNNMESELEKQMLELKQVAREIDEILKLK